MLEATKIMLKKEINTEKQGEISNSKYKYRDLMCERI